MFFCACNNIIGFFLSLHDLSDIRRRSLDSQEIIGCRVIFPRLSVRRFWRTATLLVATSAVVTGSRSGGATAKIQNLLYKMLIFSPNVDPAIILFQCEGAVIHWLSVDWEVWENTSTSLFCSLLDGGREGGMGGGMEKRCWGCARLYADVVVKTEAPADDLTAAGSHWAGTQTAPPVAQREKSTTAGFICDQLTFVMC